MLLGCQILEKLFYESGSQRWKHGGPQKASKYILAAHEPYYKIFFVTFGTLIGLKLTYLVVFLIFIGDKVVVLSILKIFANANMILNRMRKF